SRDGSPAPLRGCGGARCGWNRTVWNRTSWLPVHSQRVARMGRAVPLRDEAHHITRFAEAFPLWTRHKNGKEPIAMSITQDIERILTERFAPTRLEVSDES